jgi:hypothetical protein
MLITPRHHLLPTPGRKEGAEKNPPHAEEGAAEYSSKATTSTPSIPPPPSPLRHDPPRPLVTAKGSPIYILLVLSRTTKPDPPSPFPSENTRPPRFQYPTTNRPTFFRISNPRPLLCILYRRSRFFIVYLYEYIDLLSMLASNV